MMKNKFIALGLALCLSLGLCGCQLALPENSGERDKLIGAFVTVDHVDTISLDIGPAGKLETGHEPIYAEYYEETYENDYGETVYTSNYRFTELEGISCFMPYITEENGEIYNTIQIDALVQNVDRELKTVNDDKQLNSVSGELYVPEGSYIKFFLNPVYQKADGSVYLTGGQGAQGDGGEMGLTLSENTKTEIGGKSIEYGFSVEVWVKERPLIERVRLVEMGEKNEILRVSEFSPAELPESFETVEGTVCVVQENFYTDGEGEQKVERLALSPDEDEHAEILVPEDMGYLVPQRCEIVWR